MCALPVERYDGEEKHEKLLLFESMSCDVCFNFEVQIKPDKTWKKTSTERKPRSSFTLAATERPPGVCSGLACFALLLQRCSHLISISNPNPRRSSSAQSFAWHLHPSNNDVSILPGIFINTNGAPMALYSKDEFWWAPSAVTWSHFMHVLRPCFLAF